MHGKLRLVPVVDGRVAVAATERGGNVVRPHVTATAIVRLNIEVPLLVTVETGCHRADRLTFGRVETMANGTMTSAAFDHLGRVQNDSMRLMKESFRGGITKVAVTRYARRFEAGGRIRNQLIVSSVHVACA
jgi:hypothetical protein